MQSPYNKILTCESDIRFAQSPCNWCLCKWTHWPMAIRYHIEVWTNWLPYCRRQFQLHFLQCLVVVWFGLFVIGGVIECRPVFVQVMAWQRTDDAPKPMMTQINGAIWRHQTTVCYPGVGVRVQQKCVCDWPYRKISCTETFTMATNNVLPSPWSFIIGLCSIKTYWWPTNTAHYNDFTWAPGRLKSPATRVFV